MIPESNVVQIKPRRLSEREAAAYLGPVTPRTLQDWRIKGMGPAYTKLGGRVAYDVADLDSFIATRRVEPKAARAGTTPPIPDRKSDASGKSVFVRVDLGGRRIYKKKNKNK